MTIINIFTENIFSDWKLDEKDVIEKVNEKWVKLAEETNSRKKEIENILDSMWEN